MDQTLAYPLERENLSEIDVVCLFGALEEAALARLTKWLTKAEERYLIIVEEREELFLQMKESALGKNPRVRLFFHQQGEDAIFALIAWEFLYLRFHYALGVEEKRTDAARFFKTLQAAQTEVHLLASDCQDLGEKVLRNSLHNLSFLPKSFATSALKGCLQGVPAVVCGAGPSLGQEVARLGQLKEQAVLMAAGSAMRALSAGGAIPHMAAMICPDHPYQRFASQEHFEVPLFYQSRVASHVLELAHAPLGWTAASGSSPLEHWLAEACGLSTANFPSGWTVANFAVALAAQFGCNPIILVGMDFCCAGEAVYASGIEATEHRDGFVTCQNMQGRKCRSKRDWMMSAEWISAFARAHPEIQWINTSASGLAIEGVPNSSLEQVLRSHSWHQQEIVARFNAAIRSAGTLPITLERVQAVRAKLQSSFARAAGLCDELLGLWQKSYPGSPMQKGDYALREVELEQEICVQHFLSPLWEIWKHPIYRKESHTFGRALHRILFFKRALEANLKVFA